MNFDELKLYVEEKIKLVKSNPQKLKDPLDRTTEFLIVLGKLNDFRYNCECDKARIQTVTDALFKNAKDASDAKNITEKKVDATVNIEYTTARESLERVEAMIKWAKEATNIFNHAHLTYRQISKEG